MPRNAQFIFLLIFSPIFLFGQFHPTRPRANKQQWSKVSSEHFDIYFAEGDQSTATRVAKYAEQARYELADLLDYNPEAHYTFYYFNDADQLLRSNIPAQKQWELSGEIALSNRSRHIIHPGSSKELYHRVRAQVASVLIEEFNYGLQLSDHIQGSALFHEPRWYVEGLADYLGNGWTYEDEMWLSAFPKQKLLQQTLSGDGEMSRVLRKSVWHYIVLEYGEGKLAEIVYLARIARSMESGMLSVLGIGLNTLTDRWREFLVTRQSLTEENRLKLQENEAVERIPLKKGTRLISFDYHPLSQTFALYLDKNGKHSVQLYEIETGKFQETGIHSGFKTPEAADLSFHYPIAWSHDGSQIATVSHRKDKTELVFFQREDKSVKRFPLPSNIRKIQSLNWSYNRASLVVSALRNGQMDLFITPTDTAYFQALTNDPYDDIEAVWSLDDDLVFFSSNRDTSLFETQANHWKSYQNDFDLYALDRGSQEKLNRITHTPHINERQAFPPSSFELVYRSDESGILNFHKVNIFLKESQALSNLSKGVSQMVGDENTLAFSSPLQGKMALYLANSSDIRAVDEPEKTPFRQADLLRRKKEEAQNLMDFLPSVYPNLKPNEPLENQPNTYKAEEEKIDDKPQNEEVEEDTPIRYYVFDEEEDEKEDVYEVKPEAEEEETKYELQAVPSESYEGTAQIFGPSQAPDLAKIKVTETELENSWSVTRMGLHWTYDPIARYQAGLQLNVEDVLQNHSIQATYSPSFNFRNHDAQIEYVYKRMRADFFAQAKLNRQFFRVSEGLTVISDTTFFRYERMGGTIGIRYPFSAYLQLEGSVGMEQIRRLDLNLVDDIDRDEADEIVQARLALSFDKVKYEEDFAYGGGKLTISAESRYALQRSDFLFHTFRFQATKYLPIYNKITLETSLNAALSVGNHKQLFYMGGIDNWILGVFFDDEGLNEGRNQISPDLYDFQYQEFVTPVRGFRFNARNGTQYVMANAELHIPISRLVKGHLNSGPLYNFELVPFLDIGTVWRSGNPFSQRNPTDTQIIGTPPVLVELQTLKSPFLVGFGAGAKFRFLGYSIRYDVAWGIDDNTLRKPQLLLSLSQRIK